MHSSDSTAVVLLSPADTQWIVQRHRYVHLPNGRPIRNRIMTTWPGIAPPDTLGCFGNSSKNMTCAIWGRVLSKEVNGGRVPLLKTQPPVGHGRDLNDKYFKEIAKGVPSTTPKTPGEFAELYRGRKRTEYRKAAEHLSHHTLSRRDAVIKLFLKYEKDVRSLKPSRIPRVILPPKPTYTVATGRFVHQMEKLIYRMVDEMFGFPVVSKGLNYRQVAKVIVEHWRQFARPCAMDCDVSKMDQSITKEILEAIFDLLAKIAGVDEAYLRQILQWTAETRVKGRADDGTFEYIQEGTLSSGMCYTSLVGVLVVTGAIYLFWKRTNIKVRVVDAGDDFTLFFESADLPVVQAELVPEFARLGLTLEVGKPVYEVEQVEFCQCHPIKVGGDYMMVRNTRSAAAKDSASLRRRDTPMAAYAWLKACGKAGMASQGGTPIATARYRMMLRSAEAIKGGMCLRRRQEVRFEKAVKAVEIEGSYAHFGAGLDLSKQVIDDDARYTFYLAFGMPPHLQRAVDRKSVV